MGLGLLAAFRQGRSLDKIASMVAVVGVSVPHYWAGIDPIIVFSVQAELAASHGGRPTAAVRSNTCVTWRCPRSLCADPARRHHAGRPLGRADILSQEFVLALRAKGLAGRRVFTHVVKNAAPQIFTVLGLQFGFQLGGSVLVEAVFSWPGTGYLLNLAIFQRDIPVLQGVILVLATFFVLLNLVVDLLQTLVDPRDRAPLMAIRAVGGVGPGESPGVVNARRESLPPDVAPMSYWRTVAWRLARDPATLVAGGVLIVIVLSAVLAPWLAPYDSSAGSIRLRLAPVGAPGHVLGTDEQGRDMLSQGCCGAAG